MLVKNTNNKDNMPPPETNNPIVMSPEKKIIYHKYKK